MRIPHCLWLSYRPIHLATAARRLHAVQQSLKPHIHKFQNGFKKLLCIDTHSHTYAYYFICMYYKQTRSYSYFGICKIFHPARLYIMHTDVNFQSGSYGHNKNLTYMSCMVKKKFSIQPRSDGYVVVVTGCSIYPLRITTTLTSIVAKHIFAVECVRKHAWFW